MFVAILERLFYTVRTVLCITVYVAYIQPYIARQRETLNKILHVDESTFSPPHIPLCFQRFYVEPLAQVY